MRVFAYKDFLYQHVSNIFLKLREQLRDEANLAPDGLIEAEKTEGVRRANLPDPDDYDEKLAAMTSCEALELGVNEVYKATCALYIRHTYNQAVVEAFVGDEYFRSDMSVVLHVMIGTVVRIVQKLSAAAKAAVGVASGPFSGKNTRKR